MSTWLDKAKTLKQRAERNDKPDVYLSRLPRWIGHFLGHREEPWKNPPMWIHSLSVLLVTFAAMMCHEAMFIYGPVLKNWHAPGLLPSFAAAAILLFNVTTVPLAQPRNFLAGTIICSFIGICICKFFMVHNDQEQHLWIAGALAVAVASMVMDITGTVHPPAGAAAILPCMDDSVRALGWKYLPAVVFTLLLFLGIALLLNNIVLRYPSYWWKPKPQHLAAVAVKEEAEEEPQPDPYQILILPDRIDYPPGIEFDEFELTYMETMQNKLAEMLEDKLSLRSTRTLSAFP